jgi:hypothetical protein
MCTTRIDKDRAVRGRVWAGGIRGRTMQLAVAPVDDYDDDWD